MLNVFVIFLMIKHYTYSSVRYTYGIVPYAVIVVSRCMEKEGTKKNNEEIN